MNANDFIIVSYYLVIRCYVIEQFCLKVSSRKTRQREPFTHTEGKQLTLPMKESISVYNPSKVV